MDESGRAKVVVSEPLDERAADWLGERVRLVRVPYEDVDRLRRELADAEGLVVRTYTRVDEELLAASPRLRVVGRGGVGLDNIDLAACRARGVEVVHTPDANTQAVVEYTWALILDAVRPRPYLDGPIDPEAFHEQRRTQVGRELGTMTLGVLGMGRIGRRVARVGGALGMRVVWCDLLSAAELGLDERAAGEFVAHETLWAESDILTLHVDGRAGNRGLIGEGVLAKLKPTCWLINTSRGFVVDPAALAAWARERATTGGAVLDVHDPEPPPADYPLFGLGNVKLLPHLAARTDRALANMSWVVRDVARVLGV